MATKKQPAAWPFPSGDAPKTKTKKPTKKELAEQKVREQEQLIATLKFTPRTYKVSMWGYGGEVVMGTIKREIYDYFVANKLSVSDFVWNEEYAEIKNIPEDMWFCTPGSWYDCDDLCHTNGVSRLAGHLQVDDENGNEILNRDLDSIDGTDIELSIGGEYWAGMVDNGVVYIGRSNEKGTFFDSELELTAPFDQTKLMITYDDVEGEPIAYNVSYDGVDLDNWGANTDGKSSDFEFVLIEDGEEVDRYTEPVNDYVNYWPEDYERTADFKFTKKNRPPTPGEYKCEWSPGFGTSYGNLEWTGDRWLEYEYGEPKEVAKVTKWSGLNWDTSDMTNKPKRKPRKPRTEVYPYPSQAVLKAERDWDPAAELEKIPVPEADDPDLIYAECVQCSWRGPIDDTWMDEETSEMQCPECKEPVEIQD